MLFIFAAQWIGASPCALRKFTSTDPNASSDDNHPTLSVYAPRCSNELSVSSASCPPAARFFSKENASASPYRSRRPVTLDVGSRPANTSSRTRNTNASSDDNDRSSSMLMFFCDTFLFFFL